MKSIFDSPVLTKLLVIALVLLGFAGVIYLMSGLPTPREQNRIRSTGGDFSIICPPDWEPEISSSAVGPYRESILITPIKAVGVLQKFFVGKFRDPVDPEQRKAAGMKPTKFQGSDALVGTLKGSNDFTWMMLFQRGGDWYEISIRLRLEDDIPNSSWWPYVESFRTSAKPASTTASS